MTNNIDLQQYLFTYNEVQELLDKARLEGWREGMDEGYKAGKKQGVEEMERKWKDGQRKGIKQGIQLGEHKEQVKWSAEGKEQGR
jgi:hypothetical protein